MEIQVRNIQGDDPLYHLDKRLGRGGFGDVWKARRKSDNQVVAKKIIVLDEPSKILSIKAELNALRNLTGCRNVVQWSSDVVLDTLRNSIHLHMTYYPMGDLADSIQQHKLLSQKFSQVEVVELFQDIVNALMDCHARGIFHRDIKPANILLTRVISRGGAHPSGYRLAAHLTDFGVGKFTIAAIMKQATIASTLAGTKEYMAPEALFGVVGPETDIFAVGCVIFEICELRMAFSTAQKLYQPSITAPYHDTIKQAVNASMNLNRAQRPTIDRLAQYLAILTAAVNQPLPPVQAHVRIPSVAKQPVWPPPMPFPNPSPVKHPQAYVQPVASGTKSDTANCLCGSAAACACCLFCCSIM